MTRQRLTLLGRAVAGAMRPLKCSRAALPTRLNLPFSPHAYRTSAASLCGDNSGSGFAMMQMRSLLGWSVRTIAGLPGSCVCAVCGRRLSRFLPYTAGSWRPFKVPPLMKALRMIGSDVDHFSCPHCLSHDRERHLWLYLQASGLSNALSALRVLHMAPETKRKLLHLVREARNGYAESEELPADGPETA